MDLQRSLDLNSILWTVPVRELCQTNDKFSSNSG